MKLTTALIALFSFHLLGTFVDGQEPETPTQSDENVVVLFDGSDLEQWRGYKAEEVGAGWKIVDETLMFDGESGGGDIITKEEFADFELTFDWKVSEAANSGVMYRVSLGDAAPYLSGPEYQVLDDDAHGDGKNPTTSSGALYALYEAEGKTVNAVGEWNTAKIVLNGNRVEHWVNDTKVVDVEMHSDEWNEKVEASKFAKWEKFGMNKSGHIAFQDHGDQVWFRDIRVKRLNVE